MRPLSLSIIILFYVILSSIYAQASETMALRQENNRFLKATVSYPDTFSAEFEGLTLFIIPPHGEFPWDITDEKSTEYYAISLISPYLTLKNKKMHQGNSAIQLAEATAQALSVTHNMSLTDKPTHADCSAVSCAAISMQNGLRYLYQTFLKFDSKTTYTISAVGKFANAKEMQKNVQLMSRNITPYKAGKAVK